MRIRGVASFVAALVAVGSACESDPIGLRARDPYIQAIVAQGFRRDMIVDMGDYFLVEGDISIRKTSLVPPGRNNLGSNPFGLPSFQWRATNIVSSSAVTYITVDLSALESSWQTAMRDAMSEWNSITSGAVMNFYEATPGQITASMSSDLPNGAVARADFPASQQPGATIQVANQFTNTLDASQKKRNLAHELGHTIGFRHTNWQTNDCAPLETPPCAAGSTGASLICSTPQTDAASVMNGGTAFEEWGGFSFEDKHAAFCLYPRDLSAIAPTYSYPGDAVATWNPVADGPEYQFVISKTGYQRYEGEDYGFGYNLFTSAWSSSPQITITGFPYTGYTTCHDGDPWVDGYWYAQLDSWVNVRYADGFTDQQPLVTSPQVLDCPTGTGT